MFRKHRLVFSIAMLFFNQYFLHAEQVKNEKNVPAFFSCTGMRLGEGFAGVYIFSETSDHNRGAILIEELTFFGKNKWYLGAGIIFLLLQALLIITLVILFRKQRAMTALIKETENKYRELIHEDRTLRLGQMTATLVHELNQPLTAILSMAQAGIRFIDAEKMEPTLLKEIFQKISEADKRTSQILSSIRGMMKLEKREKELVNLNSVVDELLEIYRIDATDQKINLEVKLLTVPVFVVADQIQIQQVLLNFLSNAAQSMENVNTGNKTITIREYTRNNTVVVAVRDQGKGIDEVLKTKLFKPFVTSRNDGFGIGLAICRSIIDEHHGEIWAENHPDGGAEFSFSLIVVQNE